MNKLKNRYFGIFFLIFFSLCSNAANSVVNIVPIPNSIELKTGYFLLSPTTQVVVRFEDKEICFATQALNEIVEPLFDKKLKISKKAKQTSNLIVIEKDGTLAAEGYTLEITPEKITIKASTAQGVFYAIQSIRQLIPVEAFESRITLTSVKLPALLIKDEPFFGYRGMMLDCCRHFWTVDEVKTAIDILAMHKMNRFHWHLTEDQGWRIEIKKYPRLTEIGSVRSETTLGHNSGKFDGIPYGGYYTQKDIKEIVQYATERFITVIPEIEIPGHSIGALAAYPWLGCKGENGDYKVWGLWGVSDQVCCAGKETSFQFWEDVLSEVIELFPSEYIHIGGDESPKAEWEKCPLCQKRIKDEGLKDEHALQGYVTQRVERFLNQHGRKLIGWDEILEGGVTPTATIMSWRGSSGGIKAAQMGNTVIMAPNSHCYLDYYQSRDTKNEPDAIGGYVSLEKAYELDPYDQLSEEQSKYILGVQGNLWTEYIHTFTQAEYMLLPRLSAISEVGWSYKNKDMEDFQKRAKQLVRYYDVYGYNYGKHFYNTTNK